LGEAPKIEFPADIDWHHWIERWDRVQDRYLVRRSERFDVMVRLIAQTQSRVSQVLDLGCGTGSLMLRVLETFPESPVWGIDFDATLLALAEERLAEFGRRARLLHADLRDKSWLKLVGTSLDAIVSATTLHWLSPQQLANLYGWLAEALRPGGIFLNADHVGSSSKAIQKTWENGREQMLAEQQGQDADDWDGFWQDYGKALGIDANEYRSKLTEPWEGSEQGLALEWHLERLRASGFEAVDCFWRLDCDAIYGGIRRVK